MDYTSIATYIALEIAGGFLKENGKEIYHKVKSMFTAEEIVTLNLLEKYPESKELRGELATALEQHFEDNPAIVEELKEWLGKFRSGRSTQNTITQDGDGNIAFQDINQSNINIKN